MKKVLLLLLVMLICLLCAAAAASPSMTDGEMTGWIAENNYLFLQSPNRLVAQLSMPINDLIQVTEDELICLGGNRQIIAVKKDGSGSRIVDTAEAASLGKQPLKLENGVLYLNDEQVSVNVCAAAIDGDYLYTVEKTGQAYALRVNSVRKDGKAVQPTGRDACAQALSGKAVTEPLNLTVTREALTLTDTAHQVTVMNLLTGDISRYPATSGKTAAACMQGGMLYRYQQTEDGSWILEAGTAVNTPSPTPAPSATPTPRPTEKQNQYTDDDGTIYYGASGKTVRKIQTRLSELGYPIWKIDGIYGDETQLAINLFCDAIHVREHRYITLKVQKKLFAKNAPYYDPYLPLKVGDQGVSVLYMQTRLKELGYDPGKPDGVYGKNTVAAVALFQAVNGMSPGPGDREKPGEAASSELLELLFAPEPTPGPFPVITPTPVPAPTATPVPTATPEPTKPATQTDL